MNEACKNIFVVGLDPFNMRQFDTIADRNHYSFHDLLGFDKVVRAERYPMPGLLEDGCARLDAFRAQGHSVDGIIGWWDFPTVCLMPLLRAHVGLPTPSLRSVLHNEHKGWARHIQSELFPDLTPRWALVDPRQEDQRLADVGLTPPFWIKPVKAHSGWLGYRVETERDFQKALDCSRRHQWRFAEPFNWFLSQVELPDYMQGVDGSMMIAEEIIDGAQCTLESYVHRGEVFTYGVIDSTREANRHTFRAFRYPSRLPAEVQERLKCEARRWAERIQLDETPFNMEFYWDKATDRIWVLEINSRLSKSHVPLFAMVDGASHQQVAVRLAQGRDPAMPRRQGPYAFGAKYYIREFEDAYVSHVPTEEDIARIERDFPGVQLRITVQQGQWLHDLTEGDSYSYEVGVAFVGADGPDQAEEIYEAVKRRLPLELIRRQPDAPSLPRHSHG